MKIEAVADPITFFNSIGLHDVSIARIELDSDRESLEIAIDELYWNLEGHPEYPGARPCILVFSMTCDLYLDVEISEGIRITDHVMTPVQSKPSYLRMELDLNIGGGDVSRGRRSIAFSFQSLAIHDRADVP